MVFIHFLLLYLLPNMMHFITSSILVASRLKYTGHPRKTAAINAIGTPINQLVEHSVIMANFVSPPLLGELLQQAFLSKEL